jgi:hypothetical protein
VSGAGWSGIFFVQQDIDKKTKKEKTENWKKVADLNRAM